MINAANRLVDNNRVHKHNLEWLVLQNSNHESSLLSPGLWLSQRDKDKVR